MKTLLYIIVSTTYFACFGQAELDDLEKRVFELFNEHKINLSKQRNVSNIFHKNIPKQTINTI